MNRRYYLLIFILLFAAALWGLVHAFESDTPSQTTTASNSVLSPQPAAQQ